MVAFQININSHLFGCHILIDSTPSFSTEENHVLISCLAAQRCVRSVRSVHTVRYLHKCLDVCWNSTNTKQRGGQFLLLGQVCDEAARGRECSSGDNLVWCDVMWCDVTAWWCYITDVSLRRRVPHYMLFIKTIYIPCLIITWCCRQTPESLVTHWS